jgi:predicted O-methyltransferase YrrM
VGAVIDMSAREHVQRAAKHELAMTPRDYLFSVRMAVSAVPSMRRLAVAPLEGLFLGIEKLTISIQHEPHDRGLPYGEAFVLSLITAYLRPRRIFEIGTASGQSTLLMARQAPEAQIETLDLGKAIPTLGREAYEPPVQDTDTIGSAYRDSVFTDQITQHFGDSATFDYSDFEHDMDLVFVDGAHIYDYVTSDSRNALLLIRPGGTIVWDDCSYTCPGVSKALLGLMKEGLPIYRIYGTRFATLAAGALS